MEGGWKRRHIAHQRSVECRGGGWDSKAGFRQGWIFLKRRKSISAVVVEVVVVVVAGMKRFGESRGGKRGSGGEEGAYLRW